MNPNQTVVENFLAQAKECGSCCAMMFKKDARYHHISFNQLANEVKQLAVCWQKLGVVKGDKIAILSGNSPEWAKVDLSAQLVGAVIIPIHNNLSVKIIEYILAHAEVKVLFISGADLVKKILAVKDNLPNLKTVICIDDAVNELSKKFNQVLSFNQFRALNSNEEFISVAVSADDLCSIIYTSGTTGLPKGVMLTHRNFISDAMMTAQAVLVKSDDIFLSFLPLSHVLERTAGYYIPLLCGATIAYAESFKQLAKNIKEIKPTILIAVPRVFEKIYDAVWDKIRASSTNRRALFLWALKQKPKTISYWLADTFVFNKVRQTMGGRLRFAVSGGAALDHKIAKFFHRVGILILEGYGLTETAPVLAVNGEASYHFGSVGKVLSGVELKIADDKEILVRGANIMIGYYKNEADTKAVIDADGWLHTGDLGFLHEDGFLTIIGRKKEMIVSSGGKNIWPEPLEQELNRDQYIDQSMIIGHKRQFVSALIVPNWEELAIYLRGESLALKTREELVKDDRILHFFAERIFKINEHISEYEHIRQFTLLTKEFSADNDELTPTLKLRRHVVEHHYGKEIEEMYKKYDATAGCIRGIWVFYTKTVF
ncbi:MAG: long-chain fatty acid--CoA ligase, partial [bacterium]